MRYAKNLLFAFLAWLLMPLAANIPRFLIRGTLYPALCEWFPSVFRDFSPITEAEGYLAMTAALDITVATLTVALFSYITVRYDNERMEYMVSRTDGMYSLSEGVAIYYPRYLAADVAVAIIVPIPQLVLAYFIPEHIHELVDPVFDYLGSFGELYTSHLGYLLGSVLLILTVLLTRLLAGLRSLKAWQGIWLSEI